MNMPTHRITLKLALLCFPFLLAIDGHAQKAALAKEIDDYLSPFVQGKNFIGAVLVVQGEKVLFDRAYGKASYSLQVPNTPKTRFHIASISKPFTAAAILLLEERGKLRLDDPISKYVPDFISGDKITLRHLLTHTSGIPNVNNF